MNNIYIENLSLVQKLDLSNTSVLELENIIASLKDNKKTIQEENIKLKQEIISLKTECNKIRNDLLQIDYDQTKFTSENEGIFVKSLQKEKQELVESLAQLQQQSNSTVSELKAQISSYRLKICEMRHKTNYVQKEISNLQPQELTNVENTNDFSSQQHTIQTLTKDNSNLLRQIDALKLKEESQTHEIKTLKDKLENSFSILREFNDIKVIVNSLNQKCQKKDIRIQKLNSKISILQNSLLEQNKSADEQKAAYQQHLNEIKAKYKQTIQSHTLKDENSKDKKIKKLMQVLSKINSQKNKLEEENRQLKVKLENQAKNVDISHLMIQNKNIVSLFNTHFRLISQKINLLISKQFSQFSSQILSLSSRVSYMQKRLMYHPSYMKIIKHSSSLMKQNTQNILLAKKELYRGFRALRLAPPSSNSATQPTVDISELAKVLVDAIPPKKILRFERKLGTVEIHPTNNKIETTTVISYLSEPLGLHPRNGSDEFVKMLLMKAKKKIERSNQIEEKYEDAKQVLQTIKNVLFTTSKEESIELLQQIFVGV
ncbi:hypothetical protein TRFO_41519 [Tritrichomonas foetus]|uniref:Uncharacterized protein n=1 Tax=Tritrichomonas foetus TaxID=1144522 RepID=A0A1J4L199_9EUKA|nr:hypothetical protein TRFO_41519 [Tritrichomonas foetus]|eukprot:OHT16856.1 hypothetical protein TRFO_41519 [Tritrichomonas foetus]